MIDRLRADHDFPLSDLVQRARAAVERVDGEQRIFAGALAIVAVHLIDTTLVHTGSAPGACRLSHRRGFGRAGDDLVRARWSDGAAGSFALGLPRFSRSAGRQPADVIKVTHTGADTRASMAIAGLVLLCYASSSIWRGRRAGVNYCAPSCRRRHRARDRRGHARGPYATDVPRRRSACLDPRRPRSCDVELPGAVPPAFEL